VVIKHTHTKNLGHTRCSGGGGPVLVTKLVTLTGV
jgi:hypothetical protein